MVKSVYVPEAGGIIDFADDVTPTQISGYINAKYPRTAAASGPAAQESDNSGIFGRFAYGLGTGITDIPGGIAALGLPAEKAAQTGAGQFSQEARKYLESTFGIDPTKEATTAQMLAQGLGSAASFFVPGGAAAKGASLLGKGASIAGRAGTITAAGQGVAVGSQQRAEQINQQLASGMKISETDQLAAQRLSGFIGASEALPLGKFFGPLATILSKVPASKAPIVEKILSNRLARLTKAGIEEGAQEAASGIANDLMEYGVYNPDVEIGQDIISNAGTGAFVGSTIEGVVQLALGRKIRGARQLQSDLQTEMQKNSEDLRKISISESADRLAQSGVSGNVTIEPNETPEGFTVYTLTGPDKKPIIDFQSEDDAVEAGNVYQKMTGASVNIDVSAPPKLSAIRIGNQKFPTIEAAAERHRKIKARVDELVKFGGNLELVSKVAAQEGVAPQIKAKQISDEIAAAKRTLSMFDRYFSPEAPEAKTKEEIKQGPKVTGAPVNSQSMPVEEPSPKPIVAEEPTLAAAPEVAPVEQPLPEAPQPEENYTEEFDAPTPIEAEEEVPDTPIGAVEMPVEESRILPDTIVEEEFVPQEVGPPPPTKTEQRPSATDEQLTALKVEMFGEPIGYSQMTPEQRASYDAERDRRFPPQDVEVYQSAGLLREPAPRNLREAHIAGPTVKDYTPETKAWLKNVYTQLQNRVDAIIPDKAKVEFKTLVGANPDYLIRGQARTVDTQYGIKSIVDLSTGILRPGMSVEDAVKSLVGTLNHEMIHVLRDQGVIRPDEWRILSRSVAKTNVPGKKYTYLDKAEAVYTPNGKPMNPTYNDPEAVVEEAVAEMYREWVLNGLKPPQQNVGLFNRITEFFRRIFQVLRNSRHEEIFKQIESGEVGRREGTPRAGETRASAGPVYNPLTSSSDWETEGAPPAGISSVNATGGTPYRISQRRPTGKNTGASLARNLLVDTATMQGTPSVFAHNVDILKTYPNMRVVPGETADQTLARFKEHVIENLLWLHDIMDPGLRGRAKNWYDGARAITDRLAKRYNLPDTTVAAVMAGLSPQKDWFQNVSLGERVIDIMMTKGQHKFDDKMVRLVRATPSMAKYAPLLELMEGRTLDEITNFNVGDVLARKHNEILAGVTSPAELEALSNGVTAYGKAIFVRFYDQAYKSRDYNIVTPEGSTGEIAKTGKGVNAKVAWGSFGEIGKAIDAILDGRKENIDALLGDKHKIRNFYNNIISPMSSDGSVTIDTHAVAAALLRPLAGGSLEVHHNFGTGVKGMPTRTKNSAVTGLQGTYAFYADAYREAAARRGILAREMQSITWEAVRGLYKPTYKSQRRNVDFIRSIWEDYRNGVIDANEARNQILNHADPGAVSINNPFWKNTPGSSLHGGSGPALNTRGVGRLGVRQATGSANGGRTGGDAGGPSGGVRFSAAPLPTYIQQQNSSLFAPTVNVLTKDKIFSHFSGRRWGGKTLSTMHGQIDIAGSTMAAIAGKEAVADKNAYITELEKLLNQKLTGNYQRMEANYSATAALAWRRRSSHIFASMLLRGNVEINFDRPGDIQSATIKVVDDPDSMKEIFNIITEKGPTDANGVQTDKSDIFRSYAVARRGEWLRSTGQNVPAQLTPQYIREVTDFTRREYPEVIEAYNKYQRFNKKLLTTAKDAGIISQAELGRLTNQMNYYGFIYEAYGEPLGPTSSQKTASKFKLRAYTGTQAGGLTSDPMFVMMQNAQFWVDSIAKNIAATKAFELTRVMGESRLLGADEAPDELAGEAADVMFFSQNGVVKRFAVKDPSLVVALGSDDRLNVGKFWEMIGLPTHILRESVTRDPGFMARNLLRDTVSAWVTSGADFTPVIDTIKGGVTALKNGASYKALGSYGVVGSYDLAMLGPSELAAVLRRNSMPLNVHTVTTKEGAVAALGSLWNRLGHISEASDAATRIAVYDAAKKQGLSDAEAAMQAIELLDFTRRGGSQALGILTKLIPFLNARIQGMDVLYQAGRSGIRYATGRSLGERDANVGKRFLLRGGMLAVIATALEALNQGDDDYEQLDDYIKTGNLILPLKHFGLEGQFLAVPKAFEVGLLFNTIPQQIYKTTTGEASGRENAELFWGSLQSTFGVNPIPQIILPGIEILTNHSFYTGLPLISEGKLRLDPSLQYNSSTSQIAMMLGGLPIFYDMTTGKFGGMSPIVIDKLISGYGGPLGTYLVQATSMMMENASIGPDRMPTEISSLPVVRSFFIDAKSKNPKVVTQAYELFRIADEANRTMSRLRQMGDAEALANYVDQNRDILKYKKYVFALADRLNKLSAQERSIERDGTMSRDEKLAAQQKLREIRIRLSSQVDQINKTLGR